jgi:hypothetical protein
MVKLKLQPREFRLRAGARSELDRRFLQIVNHLSEDTNLSEFIKNAVVEHFERQSNLSEADLLQLEFIDLKERFWSFVENIKRIAEKNVEVDKVAKLQADLHELAEKIKEV